MKLVRIDQYNWLIVSLAAFVLLILQTGLGGFANLLLLFGIAAALTQALKQVLVLALILGVFSDFASMLPDGIFVLAFSASLLALHFLASKLLSAQGRWYAQALLAGTAVLFFYALTSLLTRLFGPGFFPLASLWPQILLNLLFFYPVLFFYQWLTRLTTKLA